MLLLPKKIIGLLTGLCMPFQNFNGINKFLFVPSRGLINVYEWNSLSLKNSSPILHPFSFISSICTFKNRTLVSLKTTILILDYLIPTTRFKFFKKNITSVLISGKKVLIYSNFDKKIILMNICKLKIIDSIFTSFEFKTIQFSNDFKSNNLILMATFSKKIIVFDIKNKSIRFIINFSKNFELNTIIFNNLLGKIFIGSKKGQIIYRKKNKSKNKLNFKIKNLRKIHHIAFHKKSNLFKFIFSKNKLCFIQKKEKKCFVSKFRGHKGDIFSLNFNIKQKVFITLGQHDNTIILHKFNFKVKKLFMVKKSQGICNPIQKIHHIKRLKNFLLIENSKNLLQILNISGKKNSQNPFDQNIKFNIFLKNSFLKTRYKNFILKKIVLDQDFRDGDYFFIIIYFHKIQDFWIWDFNKNVLLKVSQKEPKKSNTTQKISFFEICTKKKIIAIGSKSNCFKIFEIDTGYCQRVIANHSIKSLNLEKCRVMAASFDLNGNFLITGCTHGKIMIRKTNKFLKINEKNLNTKILKINWCKKTDLILILSIDEKLRIIFPENLSIIGLCCFHKKRISCYSICNDSRHILTSSWDRSLKVWDLKTKKYIDKLSFSFPIIFFSLFEDEKSLLACHLNTIGIGWCSLTKEFKNSFPKKLLYKLKKVFLEKNKKIHHIHFKDCFLKIKELQILKYSCNFCDSVKKTKLKKICHDVKYTRSKLIRQSKNQMTEYFRKKFETKEKISRKISVEYFDLLITIKYEEIFNNILYNTDFFKNLKIFIYLIESYFLRLNDYEVKKKWKCRLLNIFKKK